MRKHKGNTWSLFSQILYTTIFNVTSLFGIEISENKWLAIIQFVKFGIVGISNTLISYITYTIIFLISRNFYLGNIIGFIVSVLNSFYWNNKYVFKTEENEVRNYWITLIKTFISYAFSGLILTTVLLTIWIDLLHVSELIAPLINLIITIPLNYIINKLWAFKGKQVTKS